jgi:N-acetylglucosaminyl-diphospho-decaprenol L-rhamnosyltransferase
MTRPSKSVRWHIVTVSYNSARDLGDHWATVALPDGVRWTVVDNASSDDSVEIARNLGATVIQLERNIGFGAANNVGARSVESEYIVFANPDVLVDTSTLSSFETTFSTGDDLVLAPQLLNPDGSAQPSGRSFPTLASKLKNRLPDAARRDYQITAREGEQRYVSWFIGAAVVMTTKTYRLLPWDERFFVYYEDSDLGLRAWKAGHRVVLDGSIRWIHAWARETAGFNPRAWRLEIASMAKFYSRYPHLLLPNRIAALFHPERRYVGRVVGDAEVDR